MALISKWISHRGIEAVSGHPSGLRLSIWTQWLKRVHCCLCNKDVLVAQTWHLETSFHWRHTISVMSLSSVSKFSSHWANLACPSLAIMAWARPLALILTDYQGITTTQEDADFLSTTATLKYRHLSRCSFFFNQKLYPILMWTAYKKCPKQLLVNACAK